ncbi:OmpA family protein [Arcobacter sp. YIC-464]|uniref:OmpA family protein n=1 Tax=Arcobacter sp. YIC-464 TaxID=3376631 RepID=UPI003C24ED73
MSFGTKIFSLFIMLIALIIYTVASFDYSKVQTSSQEAISNEKFIDFDTESIIKYIEDIKTKALKIKDDILKDNPTIKEESSSEEIENQEIDEQKVQEELTSNNEALDEQTNITETSSSIEADEKVENSAIETSEDLQTTEEVVEEETIEQEPKLSATEIQEQINTILKENKIVFKRRSVDITEESFSSVQKVADILKEYEMLKIEIAGHTDSRGRASLNLRISQDRANSVKKELIKLGVKEENLKAVGYGEKFPIAKDDKNGLSEINRRVEINIIGEN